MAKKSKKEEVTAPDSYEVTISPEQQEEDIRLTAYHIWESKGRRNGWDIEDWLEAEKFVND
jgi:hypothetical protein